MTFDDGPTPDVTPEILNILKIFNAKATFFCIGKNVKNYPETFKKIIEAGHDIGNHTFNHLNGWKTKTKYFIKNIKKCEDYFESTLFRPPYGRISSSQIKLLKKEYTIIMWSVLTGDFDNKITKEQCLSNAINNTKAGSIVVFHNSKKAKEKVLYVLPKFLKHFIDKGFTIGKLLEEIN
ncbi:MAG: polysaccharide deacetylase family protein [Bacteroidales bacterium]|nr:polysaccharide deacetylase family protein [Bacteroidales bacterium]